MCWAIQSVILPELEAGQRRTAPKAFGARNQVGIIASKMDSDCLSDGLHEQRTRLSARQLFVQAFHEPMQLGVCERGEIPQASLVRIRSKNFFQGALDQRQFDED